MYINSSNTNAGLFANNAGTIQNIKITDSYVHAKNETAGIYGTGVLVGVNTGTVQKCSNAGEILYESNNTNITEYIGAVIGDNQGEVNECHNTGNINFNMNSQYNRVGGVCGRTTTGSIKNSTNKASITGVSIATGDSIIGGVIGVINTSSNAEGILNNGRIEISNKNTSSNAELEVGGAIGYINSNSIGTNIVNTGEINVLEAAGKYVRIGGVTGIVNNEGTMTDAKNYGVINSNNITGTCLQVGGISGTLWNSSTITNAYNNGEEINLIKYELVRAQAGGNIGNMYNNSKLESGCNLAQINIINGKTTTEYSSIGGITGISGNATINMCKNTGKIKYNISGNDVFIGGIVGENYEQAKTTYSYSKADIEGTFKIVRYTRIGRIVGLNATGTTVNNCYTTGGTNNTGTSGTKEINFFHGSNGGTINNVYYLSETTAEGYDYSVRNFAGTTSNMTKANFITQIGSKFFKTKAEEVYPVLIWE